MEQTIVRQLYRSTAEFGGKEISISGWIRNIRVSKNFGFIELNDGTFFKNIQIVFEDGKLSNFADIAKLNIGSATVSYTHPSTKNIMSVNVPRFTFELSNSDQSAIYPYGFAATSSELDAAIKNLSRVFERMLELAESEKSAQLLAQEIERTRRRVNALEYVMIPDLRDTIKSITMKLEENERGNITRLMKVKDMMIKEQIEHHWAEEIQ